ITLLSEQDEYLSFLDHEIKSHLRQSMSKKRISIQNRLTIEEVAFNALRNNTELKFRSAEGDRRMQVIETEHVLYLGGRKPNVEQLNLDAVGINTDDQNFIVTNEAFETSAETIYAAGDVVGFLRLASDSFTQCRLSARYQCSITDLDIPVE